MLIMCDCGFVYDTDDYDGFCPLCLKEEKEKKLYDNNL